MDEELTSKVFFSAFDGSWKCRNRHEWMSVNTLAVGAAQLVCPITALPGRWLNMPQAKINTWNTRVEPRGISTATYLSYHVSEFLEPWDIDDPSSTVFWDEHETFDCLSSEHSIVYVLGYVLYIRGIVVQFLLGDGDLSALQNVQTDSLTLSVSC